MLKVGGGRAAKKFSASLIALMTGLVVTAFAIPAHATAPGGPYGVFAQGTVAHVHALDVMGTKVLDAEVGQASAAVKSNGLPTAIYNEYDRPIVRAGFAGKNSYGQASLLEAGLGVTKTDANQIAPFVSEAATSGGTKVDDVDPIHVPGSPLLYLDALHTTAVANWNANTCVIGQPISASQATAATAQLVNLVSNTNKNDSFPQALVGIQAIHSHSYEILYPGKGPGLGLASVTVSDAVHLALLQGTANEVDIDVAPAFLVTQADGTNGGAKVTYEAPIAKISAGGQVLKILTDITGPIDLQIPPGAGDAGTDMLLRLKLGTLLPLVSSSGPAIKTLTKPDGTIAQGSVNVLELTLLKVPEVPLTGAVISVGHLEAAAQVPEGGVSCPIPVTKTPDVQTVQSGHSFTTTIKVENPWVCPLVLSNVSDQIDTIEGTPTFQITSATPDPTSPDLPTADGLTSKKVEWTKNLPTIPPGGSATFTVTLKTGGGAGKIKDIATAAGSVSNCKPAPGSGETEVTGITNVKVPVTGIGTFTEPQTQVQGKTILPKTGVADSAYSWAGGLMVLTALGGGLALRRRKFKLDA